MAQKNPFHKTKNIWFTAGNSEGIKERVQRLPLKTSGSLNLKQKVNGSVLVLFLLSLISVVGCVAQKNSRSSSETGSSDDPKMVGLFIESVSRQINIDELQRRYPGSTEQKIDPAALRADAIVGWYDKGNSFHEQKMQNNLPAQMGATRILPGVLKGNVLR